MCKNRDTRGGCRQGAQFYSLSPSSSLFILPSKMHPPKVSEKRAPGTEGNTSICNGEGLIPRLIWKDSSFNPLNTYTLSTQLLYATQNDTPTRKKNCSNVSMSFFEVFGYLFVKHFLFQTFQLFDCAMHAFAIVSCRASPSSQKTSKGLMKFYLLII